MITPLCSGCSNPLEPNRFKKQKYCRSCHAAYMRSNRKMHSELSDQQKLKANCRSYLNVYIKRGLIKKQPCLICGDKKSQAHHDDYLKPLEVTWLCHQHHVNYHRLANIAA